MNEPSEVAKALEVLIRNTGSVSAPEALSYAPTSHRGYGSYSRVEDNVRLREMWRSIRKRLGLVIGFCALATTLVAVYMARKPDIYQAQAEVQIDLEGAN